MTGKAKLLIQSESKMKSWNKLKTLLICEFGSSCNSAKLHTLLLRMKVNDNESLDEYF